MGKVPGMRRKGGRAAGARSDVQAAWAGQGEGTAGEVGASVLAGTGKVRLSESRGRPLSSVTRGRPVQLRAKSLATVQRQAKASRAEPRPLLCSPPQFTRQCLPPFLRMR